MDVPPRLQPVQPVPVPAELTQLAAASVQDEWCQLLILREQVGPPSSNVTPLAGRWLLQKIDRVPR